MKTIDLNISIEGFLWDERNKKPKKEEMLQTLLGNFERAIASSFQKLDPRSGQPKDIKPSEHRKMNRIMRAVDAHKEGVVEMTDGVFADLIVAWKGRSLPPMIGNLRKIFDRIDHIVCEDDFKEDNKDEDAEDETVDEDE